MTGSKEKLEGFVPNVEVPKTSVLKQVAGDEGSGSKSFSESDVPILREWVFAEDNNLSLT